MIRSLLLGCVCWVVSITTQAQDTTQVRTASVSVTAASTSDTTQPATDSADALLASLTDSVAAPPLLPDHMLLSQRVVWGKKGLMRLVGAAPLTLEGREKELKVRRTMLKLHQIAGFATLAGFIAQGIVGAQLYNAQGNDYVRLIDTHRNIAKAINYAYGTTAALSLFSPPPAVGQRRGLSTIKLHKYLAIVHLAGMITTNILASRIEKDYSLKPYHRAAAYTTFGAFATAIIVLKF